MRIIDNKVRECVQEKGLDGIYKEIRDAAYVCYQSDTENAKKTPKEFVYDVLLNKGHTRPLEFGTVYLIVPKDDVTLPETRDMFVYVVSNPWTKIDGIDDNYFVTTNMRVIMQGFYPTDEEACQNNYNQNFLPLVEKYLADVEFPEYLKRRTYSLILSRGASDDLRTHITLSSICESSRYCNYSKGKFGGQMTAIKPYWMNVEIPEDGIQSDEFITLLSEEKDRAFIKSMENEEYEYLKRSKEGYEAQQLKRLFPLWGKCELRLCGFKESFDNFMWRRLDSHADPECTNVARLIEEIRQNKMG